MMESVRLSNMAHSFSLRDAEARSVAGPEICDTFDGTSMIDGVITEAEIERRKKMAELGVGLAGNKEEQEILQGFSINEEIASGRAGGKGGKRESKGAFSIGFQCVFYDCFVTDLGLLGRRAGSHAGGADSSLVRSGSDDDDWGGWARQGIW